MVDARQTSGGVTTYSYDSLDRLTTALTTIGQSLTDQHQFAYDPAGNLISRTTGTATTAFTYDAANQLTGIGGASVSHDAQGNQAATSDGDAYGYDDLNRPTTITAGGVGPLTATYAGVNAVDRPSLGATSDTVTSLLGVTSETIGGTTIGYTRLPTGQVISRRDASAGTRHALHADRLGSVLAVTDQTGAHTTGYAYSPYGQTSTIRLTGGHVDQPWRFTGQHHDPTGLYKMGLRYYNPDQARWTQPDPALAPDDLPFGNTYLYARGNPINYIDQTGADACGWATAGFIVGTAAALGTGAAYTPMGVTGIFVGFTGAMSAC